ncbi:SNF2 family N-terminal domain-containing protein [Trametes elegans]|nr:SNF2 family N-terminal domain-containing protein [Trametes elegans]
MAQIREAFHLEKFVSMLTYDPKIAKQDRSDVFQRYQAQYDLVDHTAAGPSRRTTRRAHTERMQNLKVHPTPDSSQLPHKKGRAVEENPSVAFWDIKAEAKSKGKQVLADPQSVTPSTVHPRRGRGKVFVEIPIRRAPGQRAKSPPRHMATSSDAEIAMPDATPANGRSSPPPRKKRRVDTSPSTAAVSERPSARRSLRSAGIVPDLAAPVPGDSISAVRIPHRAATYASVADPPASPNKVPRVKLIVRKPPPVYTHPLHRPKPAPFGGSVEALLNSFTYHVDDEVTPEELEAELGSELAIWRRVDKLRREGRMIGERAEFEWQPANAQDAWGHIVREVERPGPKLVNTQRGAVNVASKVKAHWSGETDREAKRLRVLARKTLELVIEEWKRAVYHLREQARLEREEEERKLGQEHLDAILNQSGQILEVQLHDLGKGGEVGSRSRSQSVSTIAFVPSNASDDEGSDGTEPVHGDDGAEDDSDDSDTSAPDEGISMLLSEGAAMEYKTCSSPSMSMEAGSATPLLEDDDGQESRDEPEERHRGSSIDSAHAIFPSETVTDMHELLSDRAMSQEPPKTLNGASDSPLLGFSAKTVSPSHREGQDLFQVTPSLLPFSDDLLPPPSNDETDHSSSSPYTFSQQPWARKALPSTPSSSDAPVAVASDVDIATPSLGAYSEPSQIPPKTKELRVDVDIHENPAEDATPATPGPEDVQDETLEDETEEDSSIPYYLRPYAVAPVDWDPQAKVKPPLLLRGTLRPYQQAGLEWLASLHSRNLNGILADEMGLGKTIQTIALLAHLACDRGIWGPHLIIVPTSVLLNWEMEFKKFLPGFKVLSYHGNTKQRKELRQGWNNPYHFNVCITSYTLASRDAHVFKRKRWYYMILDEAHMIKNFKSQRWNILLMFRSFRRLLLTGTPLQNNLTELWALLQFLMSGTDFANLKEFGEWFANPLEKAIELGAVDDEIQQRVSKLHTVLRPYLLRRLKRDVEKELPQKYEHIVMCPLSKRQRFLYDEFMSRADTRYDLQSGVYQKIANILMQLRKVVNHPDLFEVRPIVTSFAMPRSAIADFEIKELLVRRQLLAESDEDHLNLGLLGLRFVDNTGKSQIAARETRRLDGTAYLPMVSELPGEPPPADTRTITGYKKWRAYQHRAATIARWTQIAYLNRLRVSQMPVYSAEMLDICHRFHQPLLPYDVQTSQVGYLTTPEKVRSAVKSYAVRAEEMGPIIDKFAFATPSVVARDLPSIALPSLSQEVLDYVQDPTFDGPLHRAAVKLQIAFPDPSLLQFDCGKLQMLATLLRERKAGGHRVLIFTQMTRILDILEVFLNLHGYLYLRLDGATKVEDRQYITERFNADQRVFCFISSSRSGGVGINLTGADTVIFYDSDFNPQMDRQCEDRAHRIGQIRDVHIYRFISRHTVEEALLRKANQKRSLDDLVIQRGEFDWRTLFGDAARAGALTHALGEFEDAQDAQAAQLAAREERELESGDAQDFERDADGPRGGAGPDARRAPLEGPPAEVSAADAVPEAEALADEGLQRAEDEAPPDDEAEEGEGEGEEEGRTTVDYMLDFVRLDWEYFSGWNV